MNVVQTIKKIGLTVSLSFFSLMAFAGAPTTNDDTSIGSLSGFHGVLSNNAQTIFKITILIATLAGLILIIKGLVHLKQNYTGTGQEKHLSKGIASLGFGTALILAVPLSHALVTSFDNSGSTAGFNTGAGTVQFGQS